MPDSPWNQRGPGEVPTRRDQSTSLAAIVAVVYALVIGESVISTPQLWQHPLLSANRTVVLATVVVFVAAGWEFLAYSLNIGRFPYKVRWLPEEVGDKKPKTGTEEIRFAVDLLVAVGFAGLPSSSEPLHAPAGRDPLSVPRPPGRYRLSVTFVGRAGQSPVAAASLSTLARCADCFRGGPRRVRHFVGFHSALPSIPGSTSCSCWCWWWSLWPGRSRLEVSPNDSSRGMGARRRQEF